MTMFPNSQVMAEQRSITERKIFIGTVRAKFTAPESSRRTTKPLSCQISLSSENKHALFIITKVIKSENKFKYILYLSEMLCSILTTLHRVLNT